MRHRLGRAWEPVGSHGMNYRRECQTCGQVFTVTSPTEQADGECDLNLVRQRKLLEGAEQ